MCIEFNYENSFIDEIDMLAMKDKVIKNHSTLTKEKYPYENNLGFLNVNEYCNDELINNIQSIANQVKKNSQVFLVIGIGGSSLGAKACIEALNHNFYNYLNSSLRPGPQIFYLGNNMSASYVKDLFEAIGNNDVSINVISKSGDTLETAIAFRIAMDYMKSKYTKEDLKERVIITTDKNKGKLKVIADTKGFKTLTIPQNIGGRFSVLTPAGLLPIAVSGLKISELINGAKSGMLEYSNVNIKENIAYQYAMVRNILYLKNKSIEILANYEPVLNSFGDWWKQLFGESEGKDGLGIFPSTANFSTDLHSMGQYIQDGPRNLFVTTINVSNIDKDIVIKSSEENQDNLNYLANKTLNYINKQAFEATRQAHITGNVPNLTVTIPKLNEFYLGKLIYFFEVACAMSGLLLNVNPFNQPGVEQYKINMNNLLNSNKED